MALSWAVPVLAADGSPADDSGPYEIEIVLPSGRSIVPSEPAADAHWADDETGVDWLPFPPSLWEARRFDGAGRAESPAPLAAAARSGDRTAVALRLPGEFERHEGLLLACNELLDNFPDLFADIVSAVRRRVTVMPLVANRRERELVSAILARRKLPADSVRCIQLDHDTMWVRDYGPLFVESTDRGRVLIDGQYEQFGRDGDDRVPAALAPLFGAPLRRVPLDLEGGNLLSNGTGLVLTTTTLLERNAERGYDEATLRTILLEYFGAREVVVLEPLLGETTGHVDMFATFTSADTVVVGAYGEAIDPANAAVLDRNAARLAALRTPTGRLRVLRVPMPTNRDGVWRSYTNGIYANGTLLLPVYRGLDPQWESAALRTFRRAMPSWEVLPIDSGAVIELGGALHCLSMNVPLPRGQAVDRLPPPDLGPPADRSGRRHIVGPPLRLRRSFAAAE